MQKTSHPSSTCLRFDVPDELAKELAKDSKELSRDMQLRAVAGLVERGLISTGRAAELVGMSRVDFLDWCGSWEIPRTAILELHQ